LLDSPFIVVSTISSFELTGSATLPIILSVDGFTLLSTDDRMIDDFSICFMNKPSPREEVEEESTNLSTGVDEGRRKEVLLTRPAAMTSGSSATPLLSAAVLVVSDTAAADPTTDKAGDVLKQTFVEADQGGTRQWAADPVVEIVRDDVLEIQRAILGFADSDSSVNLVVTTGGTGFARRDVTPEAVAPLLHRPAPGIVHGMLAASFQVTPFAMMSRPVAGVRHQTLIVTLPGSPKGARENLQAVIRMLPHACLQAAGEDSRRAHQGGVKKLEKEAGISGAGRKPQPQQQHHHDHGHGHGHGHNHGGGHPTPKPHTAPSDRPQSRSNDPRLGATARARSSPYPMLSVAEAVAKIWDKSPPPKVERRDVGPGLVGYVVAEDVEAAEAVPAYRASIVDGYAVIVPETNESGSGGGGVKGVFPVASVSHAQAASLPPALKAGEIARITTGAPLPTHANAVVMVEDTAIASLTEDGTEEATVAILTDAVVAGENVREPGSDIRRGEVVLARGTRVSALGGEVGVLAAAGIRQVPVFRKPRVGVLSTGDEVTDVSVDSTLSGGMIRDSNRPSLLTLLRGWTLCEDSDGGVVDLGIARDTPAGELEARLRTAFRVHDLDLVVTTGGVSMGELDLLKPTVERALGGEVHFGRVSMKPGKPTTFASFPFKPASDSDSHERSEAPKSEARRKEKLIFGLPGNPASALVTANLFVLPCLQRLAGLPGTGLAKVKVVVSSGGRVKCDPERVEYHRVVVVADKAGRLAATSTGMQRSSRVGSLAAANALLVLPQRAGWLEEGAECEALLMGAVVGY
jgi:gephyrin